MEEGTPFQDSSFVCAVSVKRILSSLASRGGRGLAAAICMPEGFPLPPPFTKNQGAGSTFLRVACRCPPKKRNPSEKSPNLPRLPSTAQIPHDLKNRGRGANEWVGVEKTKEHCARSLNPKIRSGFFERFVSLRRVLKSLDEQSQCLPSLSLSCVDFGTSLSSFFSCIAHPHFFFLARSVCVLCRRRVRIANSMESSLVHPLHRPSRKALSHAAAEADGPSGTQYPLFTRAAHRPTTVHSKKEKKTPILLPLRPRQEDNSTASKNATQRDRKCTHP